MKDEREVDIVIFCLCNLSSFFEMSLLKCRATKRATSSSPAFSRPVSDDRFQHLKSEAADGFGLMESSRTNGSAGRPPPRNGTGTREGVVFHSLVWDRSSTSEPPLEKPMCRPSTFWQCHWWRRTLRGCPMFLLSLSLFAIRRITTKNDRRSRIRLKIPMSRSEEEQRLTSKITFWTWWRQVNQSKLRQSSCSIRTQAPSTMSMFEAVVSKQKAQDHCSPRLCQSRRNSA